MEGGDDKKADGEEAKDNDMLANPMGCCAVCCECCECDCDKLKEESNNQTCCCCWPLSSGVLFIACVVSAYLLYAFIDNFMLLFN